MIEGDNLANKNQEYKIKLILFSLQDMTMDILEKALVENKDAKGIVIEGYPRTLNQVQDYNKRVSTTLDGRESALSVGGRWFKSQTESYQRLLKNGSGCCLPGTQYEVRTTKHPGPKGSTVTVQSMHG